MKITSTLLLMGLIFSSFMVHSSHKSHPIHSTPVLKASISEIPQNNLLIWLRVEKQFLRTQGLTNENDKVRVPQLKNYFKTHFKIQLNQQQRLMRLKSVAESKSRVNIKFHAKSTEALKTLQVFSDCLASMDAHDRMTVHIQLKNINKKYNLNKKRTNVQITF